MKSVLFASAALFAAGAAHAQVSHPAPGPLAQPAPFAQTIPAPRDVAYPGTIKLSVDATDLDRRIFNVKETVPVAGPGRITLLFPQWLPGAHSPSAPILRLGGLIVTANGQHIEWTRDLVDVNAFHIDVPQGAASVDLQMQYLSPTEANQGRVVVTPDMMNVQFNLMSLYPAGYFTRQIPVEVALKLPAGWDYATAMETASKTGDTITFKPINYDDLVDSPLFAGRYFKKIDLDPGGRSRVTLNTMADKPELLEMKPEQIEYHRNLVKQADKLFGARHFDHYDFLHALTDKMGGIGLEHHRSSENSSVPGYYTEWDKTTPGHNLLAHEYTHSWNGKYRRGEDSWTPDFKTPIRNTYLWVYEGQTQYWGYVLQARSGLVSKQDTMDALAMTAALYDVRVAREWRDLQDTVNDPIIAKRAPQPWLSWQRSEDYYSEGQLVWLDADTLIREKSGGKKSLDDFAKAFFGVNDGSFNPLTYNFDDLVKTLNAVQPYDWATFLNERLHGHDHAPLDGVTRGGWKLVYTDTPTGYFKTNEAYRKTNDLTYSIGLTVDKDGKVGSVQWNGPAFKQGLTVGAQILAVNGVAFDVDGLKAAIKAAKNTTQPIELTVKKGDRFRTVQIDYHDGLRYPRFERTAGTPDRLDAILTAKK